MQILLYVWYFLRSATLRGLFNTLALLRDEVRFEKQMGIESASIKRSESRENYHYQGASYRVLFRVFDYLDQHFKQYSFCDIGCGKGRVLYIAAKRGYKRLSGVELDGELLIAAEKNLSGLKTENLQVNLVNTDALAYDYPDRETIYFLFNPFSESVLEKVVEKILAGSSTETVFVYMNPIHRSVFDKNKKLKLLNTIKTRWYTEAVIYQRQRA